MGLGDGPVTVIRNFLLAHDGVLVRLVKGSTDLIKVALCVDKRISVCLRVHLLVSLYHLRVVSRCGVHGRLVEHLVGVLVKTVTCVGSPSLCVCTLQSLALLVLLFVVVASRCSRCCALRS